MSVFYPYIDMPYPPYAAEEAARPYETRPVEETAAAAPARPVEGEEARPEADMLPPESLPPAAEATLSVEGRDLAREARDSVSVRADVPPPAAGFSEPAFAIERIRDNRAVRDLIGTFADYDNRAAMLRYNNYLAMFTRYGPTAAGAREDDAVASLRAGENLAYSALGIAYGGVTGREVRERMAQAIDRWLAADGVFSPAMLRFASGDGFRFAPLSRASQAALRSSDVFASYDRQRIAAYLRETAQLTPSDFMVYDPTGLGALPLRERREFLARVEQALAAERAQTRAAELTYVFTEEGRLDVEAMAIADEEERRRVDAAAERVAGYYAALANSVRQYDQGIISDALG